MALNFNPIPSRVNPAVLAAMAKPQTKDANQMASKLEDRIKELFFPDAIRVGFFTCTREGLYEIALNSFVNGPALICVNSPFSRQWQTLGKGMNPNVEIFDTNFDSTFNLTLFENALESESFDAVLLVEIDPLTGIRNDISSLAGIIHQKLPDALIIVDCSASIGSVRTLQLTTDADVVLFSSEISLGLPPGMGMIALNERANFKAIGYSGSGWNLNYSRGLRDSADLSFRMQLPYALMNALEKQLDLLFLEGEEVRIARIESLSGKVKTWATDNHFTLYTPQDGLAPTVSVLRKSSFFSIDNLRDFLTSYGIVLGKCAGDLEDEAFIIAHMNGTTEEEIDLLLSVLNKFLADYDTLKSIPVVHKLSPQ